jgi:NADH-quinone oxidoreductase subunit K
MLVFGAAIFVIGLVGFLTRGSLILMVLALETMLAGVIINLVAFSNFHNNYQGQVWAIMILTVAACEAAIALALIVSLYRRKPSLDAHEWAQLGESAVPPLEPVSLEVPAAPPPLPTLTPAGLDPLVDPQPLQVSDALAASTAPDAKHSQGAADV